jgi:uncharacterized protein YkwD
MLDYLITNNFKTLHYIIKFNSIDILLEYDMNIVFSQIITLYLRSKNWLMILGSFVLLLFIVSMVAFTSISAQYIDLVGTVLSDNAENEGNTDNISINTDNHELVLLISIEPTLTIMPTSTMVSTPVPTGKPTTKPTLKPTSTVKPSPTSTKVPIPTNTVAVVPTNTTVPTVVPTSINATCDLAYSQALLTEINRYRAQNGKPAYTLNATVSIAACNHSYWMLTTGVFSHTGINGSSASQRCAMVGTTCSGENITMGNTSYLVPATVVTRWSGSAPHNGNMLGAYTHIGIGRNGNYVTVDFAF